MFIETLEFTIPVDLCDLFSSLKRGPRSNMEFPASVNSYGTTQDANIQVLLRANKLTFKVDGVSSNSSMISKSECKTLKLSVFDVDCSIDAQEEEVSVYRNVYSEPRLQNTHSNTSKRTRDYSVPEPSPPPKSSRISFSESPHSRNIPQQQSSSRPSNQTAVKSQNDLVNVKQEPEDPDLIEIEPDPEPDDIVPKKETPYMQIDYSSEVPHTQTSQSALERLSHPHLQSSHSQSPASSSSSFHQNVPHVPDYAEPGPSQVHGDQSADDFLVFQEENDDGDDNEADYSNDDIAFLTGRIRVDGRSLEERSFGSTGIFSGSSESNRQFGPFVKTDQRQGVGLDSPIEGPAERVTPDKLVLYPLKDNPKISMCIVDRKKLYVCMSCNYYSNRKNNTERHIQKKHQSLELPSTSDGQLFVNRTCTKPTSGMKKSSSEPCPYQRKIMPDGSLKFWCPLCDYYTNRRFNMERHMIGSQHTGSSYKPQFIDGLVSEVKTDVTCSEKWKKEVDADFEVQTASEENMQPASLPLDSNFSIASGTVMDN